MKTKILGSVLTVLAILLSVIPLNMSVSAAELSDAKIDRIVSNCDTIRDLLVNLQHTDSRTRVYLGRHYETIISKFITPLNVRLVENNMSTTAFIDNQNSYVATRQNFTIDYIEYQKSLEELVAMDCKTEPTKFYDKLEIVRTKRKIVADDVAKLSKLGTEQTSLVKALEAKL